MCAKRWTPEEDAIVREAGAKYGKEWSGWAEALPNRSVNAIAQRKITLGVVSERSHRPNPRCKWTNKQRVALVKCVQMMKETTGHTADECLRQIRWLQHKRVYGGL